MSRKGKTRAPTSLFAALLILFSLFLCLSGILITFVICVDRVSEFSNGAVYSNNWAPFGGSFIDYLRQLPGALYVVFIYSTKAALTTLALFPLVVVLVPFYDGVVLHSFSLLLFGVLPFVVGAGGVFWSVYLQDTHRVPKVDRPEFDDY